MVLVLKNPGNLCWKSLKSFDFMENTFAESWSPPYLAAVLLILLIIFGHAYTYLVNILMQLVLLLITVALLFAFLQFWLIVKW